MKTLCPHCGASLRQNALACPECGSDEQTGWGPMGSSDLPEIEPLDDSGYQEILQQEFGGSSSQQTTPRSKLKQIAFSAVALGLLALMAYGAFR